MLWFGAWLQCASKVATGCLYMDIQDLGSIGEIIGAVAVIATLVYLSRQIAQANNATHRQMYSQAATSVSEFWFNLAKEPELYELFRKTLTHPDDLRKAERDQAFLVLDSYLSLLESYFLHNREFNEELSQDRWNRVLNQLLNTPGGRIYWAKRREAFHEDFAAHLASMVQPSG